MPDSSRDAVPDGGKLAGMRMIVVGTSLASSTSQNGVPRRSDSMLPPEIGMAYLPKVSVRPPSTGAESEA